jgi:uroporphyrinogen decarboxylase
MNAYDTLSPEDRKKVDQLLAETLSRGGMAPVDIEAFWADQEIARNDPFGREIPQLPLGAICNWECVFDELGIEVDYWRYQNDSQYQRATAKAYNDKAENIVGRRPLKENRRRRQGFGHKHLNDLFEAENRWEGGASGSWWLMQSANTPQELSSLLDRVEKRLDDLPGFLLPDDWEQQKRALTSEGISMPAYRFQRGPCTFATSIYGPENMLFLGFDAPELLDRFRDVLIRSMLGIAELLDAESGTLHTPEERRGWQFNDDNCCLFNPELYERFAAPILKAIFDRYAPDPEDYRGQHSDSDMAHLLPILSRFDLKMANFGPSLGVREIREHLPNAVIRGQLAPFTFSRNEERNMLAELLRDFNACQPERGLVFSTAGSINNGSRLTGQRLLMAGIQRYCRFEDS